MATPTEHATCSASASSRWLNCTAAPRFEENFPEETSTYAEEGRLAHSICEISAQYVFNVISKRAKNSRIKKLQSDPSYDDEMLKTAEFYAQYLWEKAMSFPGKPYVVQEVRVDYADYAPEGFGTCDCVMIGGDLLHITDYKHGKGVEVSAENNSQMRLYALGALKRYGTMFSVKRVSMAIVQPRITENVSEESLTVDELLAWGEQIKPIALKAYSGMGEFKTGPWCRFCRGKAQCKARAENYTALEDFKDFLIEGQMGGMEKVGYAVAQSSGEQVPGVLSDADVGEMLTRAAGLVDWYNDLKDYALNAILSGKTIPGYKVVAGRSIRAFADADKALETIKAAGWDEAMLYERKPKSLAELEKLIGKKDFADLMGDQIVRPVGKPTLVDAGDKREPYSSAAADFAGATQ